jgi:predicted DNA-binding ribbon-helix-helix protein
MRRHQATQTMQSTEDIVRRILNDLKRSVNNLNTTYLSEAIREAIGKALLNIQSLGFDGVSEFVKLVPGFINTIVDQRPTHPTRNDFSIIYRQRILFRKAEKIFTTELFFLMFMNLPSEQRTRNNFTQLISETFDNHHKENSCYASSMLALCCTSYIENMEDTDRCSLIPATVIPQGFNTTLRMLMLYCIRYQVDYTTTSELLEYQLDEKLHLFSLCMEANHLNDSKSEFLAKLHNMLSSYAGDPDNFQIIVDRDNIRTLACILSIYYLNGGIDTLNYLVNSNPPIIESSKETSTSILKMIRIPKEDGCNFVMSLLRIPKYRNLSSEQLCEIALRHCPSNKLIYIFMEIYNIKQSQDDRDCIWRCADNQNFSIEDRVRLFFFLYPKLLDCKNIQQLNAIEEKSEDAAAYLVFQKEQDIGFRWWQVALAFLLIIPAIYMIYVNAVLYELRTDTYHPQSTLSGRDDVHNTLRFLRDTSVEDLRQELDGYRQPTEQSEHQDSLSSQEL